MPDSLPSPSTLFVQVKLTLSYPNMILIHLQTIMIYENQVNKLYSYSHTYSEIITAIPTHTLIILKKHLTNITTKFIFKNNSYIYQKGIYDDKNCYVPIYLRSNKRIIKIYENQGNQIDACFI